VNISPSDEVPRPTNDRRKTVIDTSVSLACSQSRWPAKSDLSRTTQLSWCLVIDMFVNQQNPILNARDIRYRCRSSGHKPVSSQCLWLKRLPREVWRQDLEAAEATKLTAQTAAGQIWRKSWLHVGLTQNYCIAKSVD
jgi:hypothetical protein